MADGRHVNYKGALKHLETLGLALTPEALRQRVFRGTIPAYKRQGGVLMFDLDELDAWYRGHPHQRRAS